MTNYDTRFTFSPRANTACPAAFMFFAALWSRSCSVLHLGQVQWRTDRSNSSVDSYSILINDTAEAKDVSFPMHFDIVRLLGATNNIRINVKINTEQGLSTFELKTETSMLKYIVPGLQV